jgi:flavin reductase ActVB
MTTDRLETPHLVGEFKDAMSMLASGVCVVTTTDQEGTAYGFAATSVTSVSMDPALLLICQATSSRSHSVFATCDALAVNVLAAGQQQLAERFASPLVDRFAHAGFCPGTTGAPIHPDALATVECRMEKSIPAGDHSILLADVRAVRVRPGEPLVYLGRRYRQIAGDAPMTI